MFTDKEIEALLAQTRTDGYPSDVRRLVHAVQAAERERWRTAVHRAVTAGYDDLPDAMHALSELLRA